LRLHNLYNHTPNISNQADFQFTTADYEVGAGSCDLPSSLDHTQATFVVNFDEVYFIRTAWATS